MERNEWLNVFERERGKTLKNPHETNMSIFILKRRQFFFFFFLYSIQFSFQSLWITLDADRATNTHQHIMFYVQKFWFFSNEKQLPIRCISHYGPWRNGKRWNVMAMNGCNGIDFGNAVYICISSVNACDFIYEFCCYEI